jgi:hypothetical protein
MKTRTKNLDIFVYQGLMFEKGDLNRFFSKPFLKDLDLLWKVDWKISSLEERNQQSFYKQ